MLLFLATHLLRLTSLGRPFLEPIYPPRISDLKDAFLRMPFSMMNERPKQLRTEQPKRMDEEKSRENKDIDE